MIVYSNGIDHCFHFFYGNFANNLAFKFPNTPCSVQCTSIREYIIVHTISSIDFEKGCIIQPSNRSLRNVKTSPNAELAIGRGFLLLYCCWLRFDKSDRCRSKNILLYRLRCQGFLLMFVDALVRRKSLFTFGLSSRSEKKLTPGCRLGLMRIGYTNVLLKTENRVLSRVPEIILIRHLGGINESQIHF